MCGFFGVVAGHGREVDVAHLQPRIERQLLYRGPDVCKAERRCGMYLAHSRLSITDGSRDADQPFRGPGGEFYLLFNGEIYNYEELRRTHLSDERFDTKSDTEVISRLYKKYGAGAFELLDGMFALAVVDPSSRSVCLARDLVGKKPLYVGCSGPQVCFSSDSSLVGAYLGASIDPVALKYYLEHRFVPPSRSLYADVKPVLPGQ